MSTTLITPQNNSSNNMALDNTSPGPIIDTLSMALKSDLGSATFTDIEHYNRRMRETKVYIRRYWLLFILCISIIQSTNNWMTFSVCSHQIRQLYEWNKTDIFILNAWGYALFIPITLCMPLCTKTFSFRAIITMANLFVCIGTIIRSLPPKTFQNNNNNNSMTLILAHIGQIFISIATPMLLTCAPSLSAIWFPKNQRTVSTATAVVSKFGGMLISYFIIYYAQDSKHRILFILRVEALLSLLCFIIVLCDGIWYNDIPQIPPSVSSILFIERQRQCLKDEMITIIKNGKIHFLAIIIGISLGMMHGFLYCLQQIMQSSKYLNLRGIDALMVCVCAVLCVMIGGIVFGALNDANYKKTNVFMIFLCLFCGILLFLFSFFVIFWQRDKVFAIICFLICVFMNSGNYGIAYEALVECMYPLREIYAACVLNVYLSVSSFVYLLLSVYLSELYLLLMVSAIQIICGLALLRFEQEYKRLDIDLNAERIKILIRTPTNNVDAIKSINDYKNMTVSASPFVYESKHDSIVFSKSQKQNAFEELN